MIALIVKRINKNNKELLRKLIHIGMGPLIPLALYLNINQTFALYFTGVISFLILLNYRYKLLPIIEDIDRKSFGTFFYSLSLFILIAIFWNNDPKSLIVGSFIMTFGDGFAGLVGRNFNSRNWLVFNQKKSLYGTLTMFFISLIIVNYFGDRSNINSNINYFVIAITATILEQLSMIGIDNFIVPIISSISFNILVTQT